MLTSFALNRELTAAKSWGNARRRIVQSKMFYEWGSQEKTFTAGRLPVVRFRLPARSDLLAVEPG